MWLTIVYLIGAAVTLCVTTTLVIHDAVHRIKSRHGRNYETVDWLLAATSVVGMTVFWPVTVLSVVIVWLAIRDQRDDDTEDPISPRI